MRMENNVIVFSNAAFTIVVGKASFGFILNSNRNIVCAGAFQVLNVLFSKKAKARVILLALVNVKERTFLRLAFCRMPNRWFKQKWSIRLDYKLNYFGH